MPEFIVTRKSDGAEVYRYAAEQPVEWGGMEFATHDHVEAPVEVEPPSPAPSAPRYVWTVLDFLRRFTPAERIAARTTRKTDAVLDDFYAMLEQATEVRSDNPDVAAGLGYMVQTGLLTPTRRDEILGL